MNEEVDFDKKFRRLKDAIRAELNVFSSQLSIIRKDITNKFAEAENNYSGCCGNDLPARDSTIEALEESVKKYKYLLDSTLIDREALRKEVLDLKRYKDHYTLEMQFRYNVDPRGVK